MSRRRSRTGISAAAIAGLAGLLLAACGGDGTTASSDDAETTDIEPRTIRFYSVFDEGQTVQVAGYHLLAEYVEDLSDGNLTIEWAGGPESIPPFESGQAIRAGTVDLAMTVGSYYMSEVPHAVVLSGSTLSPQEEQESGAWEFLNEIHERDLNAHLLGRAMHDLRFTFYTQDEITEVADYAGERFRVTPLFFALADTLGIDASAIPAAEVYQALERGVINGFAWPEIGLDEGLADQVNYQVFPSIYTVDTVFMANLDFWNSLSPEEQQILDEAARKTEEDLPGVYDDMRAEHAQEVADAGVEIIEVSDPDHYQRLAQEGVASFIRENLPEGDESESLIDLFGVENW